VYPEGRPVGKTILFLYGTLKRGQKNHRLLEGQRFVGDATIEPRYRLYDLGPYPGMVIDVANGLAVAGELWELDDGCLAKLDEFEGVPELYVRQRVALQGIDEPVESFLYNRTIPPGARSGNSWPLRAEE
jgi:gamma-glutamylaminecyclotransferase